MVLFKSLRNCKRLNKGNFMSKSNSNKIKFCGGWGQHYLKQYFPRKMLKKICFSCKIKTRKILSHLI